MQQPEPAANATPTSYYECAIDTCDWRYEVPQPAMDLNDDPAEAFAQQCAAIECAVREHCKQHDVEDWLRTVMGLREQLATAQPALACFGCIVNRHNAQKQGVPLERLPQIYPAEFVVEGRSLGMCHLNISDGPVMPGRTRSGLIVGNGHGG